MYMLDTNIIVKAIRQKNHPVRKKLLNHINGALCISSITYTELMYVFIIHRIRKRIYPQFTRFFLVSNSSI